MKSYKEAEQLIFKTEWKVSLCAQGETCWCRIIEPITPILYGDENEEEYNIVHSGAITKEVANYIVELHNKNLKS